MGDGAHTTFSRKKTSTCKERKNYHVTLCQVVFINSRDQVGVSKNGGTPKSWILIGFSIINHPFWGTPIFGNTQVYNTTLKKLNTYWFHKAKMWRESSDSFSSSLPTMTPELLGSFRKHRRENVYSIIIKIVITKIMIIRLIITIIVTMLCMYVRMYVCTYVCMHACMYVCKYLYIFIIFHIFHIFRLLFKWSPLGFQTNVISTADHHLRFVSWRNDRHDLQWHGAASVEGKKVWVWNQKHHRIQTNKQKCG